MRFQNIATGIGVLGLVFTVVFAGCERVAKPQTAAELAAALQRQGISVANQAPAALPKMRYGRIEEGVTLTGDNLSVDIIRIEDERTYKAFLGMGTLLAVAEQKTGERLPQRPEIYSQKPFVIVVRQEPTPGQVKRALDAVLGSQ
jgi:hypothetical protein